MNKDFVIFKNPHLRYRKEEFGGIAKLQLKTMLINKSQYKLINNIKKLLVYSKLNPVERKLVDKLIENNLLLKVDLKRAVELGYKPNTQ
jgi:hypothetical protein